MFLIFILGEDVLPCLEKLTEQIQEGTRKNIKNGDSSEVVNIEERYHPCWKEFNVIVIIIGAFFERCIVFLFLLECAFIFIYLLFIYLLLLFFLSF